MPKPIQNKSEYRAIRRPDVYEEFIAWFSLPSALRFRLGIHDQNDFAMRHNVSKDTLSLWKNRPDFEKRVASIRNTWAFEKTGPIVEAIYRSAIKGNFRAQKLWMTHFEGLGVKKNKGKNAPIEKAPIFFSHDDFTVYINELPQELQDRYYRVLRDLYLDFEDFRERKEAGKPIPKYQGVPVKDYSKMTDQEIEDSL